LTDAFTPALSACVDGARPTFSNEISFGFCSGQHLEQQNEQAKADWPEGTTKAYAGCSRIISMIQRASSTELPDWLDFEWGPTLLICR
jgi:hypothetical protein